MNNQLETIFKKLVGGKISKEVAQQEIEKLNLQNKDIVNFSEWLQKHVTSIQNNINEIKK